MNRARFDEFQTAVRLAENDWRVIVGNPYVVAYTQAYSKYQETLNKQKDSDKDAGELFVTAACVVTGSILLGSIGSVTMRMIEKKTIAAIAMRTLPTTMFRLFNTVRKNEGVAFAVGKLIDAAPDKVKDKLKKLVVAYLQATDTIITPEPLVQYLQMDSFMRANVNCAIRAAQAIEEEASLTEVEREAAYAHLRAAPLLNKPVRRSPPLPGTLAELIELSFYLSQMLETDRLESDPESVNGHSIKKATSVPITQRPMDPKYPNPTIPRTDAMGYTPAYQVVTIDRAGGDVQKRTNELTMKVFKKSVYSSSLFGMVGPADTQKPQELRIADGLLLELATKMKPVSPYEAIG